ncbi:dipeptide ABC transporter ATP-binding protein [Ancylobacter amanitiformis]|uniref:Peptide/nickel transport system ATP-binding protein n=1 Tax=Ancylobacter amanitiformis TaxID=217069 RepID=A0ABU0LK91_9HYPH|nr:ABC transporter ATP-binding protein [Ancylobacter amanitiformis]MDQ0509125.1 peptide/nickel transport system ATP-binding protein [Ancylobacter amanitiformis]
MTAPLLSLRNLIISAGGRRLVDGVSLDLEAGRTLAVIGESGSGKSLTGLSLLGLLPDGLEVDPATRIAVDGRVLAPRDERGWRALRGRRIAMVFQDPMACLNPFMRVGEQIEETLRRAGIAAPAERRQRIVSGLAEVELPDPAALATRYPHQLSGGQQQRVMIAMALAGEPDLLVADEPTSALDASVQADIVALLARLQANRRLALLIITHDLAVAGALGHSIAVMQHGRIVETGPAAEVISRPRDPYTARLVGARRRLADVPAAQTMARPVAVTAEAVCVDYAARRLFGTSFRAVHGASLSLLAGRTVGLLGESGSGKSTLAATLAGLRAPSAGRIRLLGHVIEPGGRPLPGALRRRCQMVFQNPYGALNPRLTIGRALAEPLALAGVPASAQAARIVAGLHEVGLDADHAMRYPHQLSGGQRQRACIARALLCEPEVLICDEVISALDMTVKVQILDLLKRLQAERGFAMLFVGHDIEAVRWISDEVLVMHQGRIVERCRPEQLDLSAVRDPYTRRLLSARLMPEFDGAIVEKTGGEPRLHVATAADCLPAW